MKLLSSTFFALTTFFSLTVYAEPIQTLSCNYSASIVRSNHKLADHVPFTLNTNEKVVELALFRLMAISEENVSASVIVITDGSGIFRFTLGPYENKVREAIAFGEFSFHRIHCCHWINSFG